MQTRKSRKKETSITVYFRLVLGKLKDLEWLLRKKSDYLGKRFFNQVSGSIQLCFIFLSNVLLKILT